MTAMIQSHIQVNDVAVEEDALIRNTVADNLIDGRAYRLGEMVVIQRRRVGL